MLKKILKGILVSIFITGLGIGSYNYYQTQNVTRLAIRGLQDEINTIQEKYNNFLDNDINLLKIIQEINRKIHIEPDIDKLLRSDVFVRGISGGGAGTIIKKTEKYMYILTCYHIVDDIIKANKRGFKLGATIGYSKTDGYNKIAGMIVYGTEVIKYDEEKDLALLKVFIIDDNLEAVSIAEKEPNLGDTVYSIGSPLGLLRTISKGILSHKENGFYFTDGIVTYGNSGGGLYNSKGQLIGVPSNVLGYYGGLDREGNETFIPETGLGLSRDLNTVKSFLGDLDEIL